MNGTASDFAMSAESTSTPISVLMSIDRGSRFSDPMNVYLRSIMIALVCNVTDSMLGRSSSSFGVNASTRNS